MPAFRYNRAPILAYEAAPMEVYSPPRLCKVFSRSNRYKRILFMALEYGYVQAHAQKHINL